MMNQRLLTTEERSELDALNVAVADAVARRTAWLDAKMVEVARLKVGDALYDLETGRYLGVVSGIYRYHAGDHRYDRYCDVDYRFETNPQCYDNTSRQPGLRVGSLAEFIEEQEARLARMKDRAATFGAGLPKEET